MKSIASILSIIALGFGLLGCPGGGGGPSGGSTSAFAVSTTAADFGVVDKLYTSTLVTTGGTAPFTWATSSGLPTGLVLDPGTGVVSGTPTVNGNSTVIFTVTDSTGQTAIGSVLFAIHTRTDVVSVDNSTPPVPGGSSSSPSISNDGRFVAFASSATLISGVSGSQIYIHDWQTNQTFLVSQNAVGTAGDGVSSQPAISSNGRFVAFTSASSNLTGDPSSAPSQIFLRDTQLNSTTLVSRATGVAGAVGAGSQPTISADGRFVAFTSGSSALTTDPDPGPTQIFLRDTQLNSTTLVSQATSGGVAVGNGTSSQPTISSNGQFVAFTSASSNLTGDPSSAPSQIFLRDTVGNGTNLVSKDNSSPPVSGDGLSNAPSISVNGGFVAFSSVSTNLGAIGGNQIYVRARP